MKPNTMDKQQGPHLTTRPANSLRREPANLFPFLSKLDFMKNRSETRLCYLPRNLSVIIRTPPVRSVKALIMEPASISGAAPELELLTV